MGMRPKSCPGLAAYSIAWHEWLQPGPRRIASTRLICFSSGSPAVDILALPPAASALPLKGMRGPTPPHPANPRAAALQAPPLRQPLTRRAAEPMATLTAKGARAKGGAARRAPPLQSSKTTTPRMPCARQARWSGAWIGDLGTCGLGSNCIPRSAAGTPTTVSPPAAESRAFPRAFRGAPSRGLPTVSSPLEGSAEPGDQTAQSPSTRATRPSWAPTTG